MAIVGMPIYVMTEAIPLFLQTLMGYTAFLSCMVIIVAGTVVFLLCIPQGYYLQN